MEFEGLIGLSWDVLLCGAAISRPLADGDAALGRMVLELDRKVGLMVGLTVEIEELV